MSQSNAIITVEHLKNYLGDRWVHKDISFTVKTGEIFCFVGPSGCGKTTVLRSILGLIHPAGGNINVLGIDLLNCSAEQANSLRKEWGMLFQHGALFSSMTVLENVMFPMQEFSNLNPAMMRELAMLKIKLVGLPLSAANLLPGELSGGMQKRGALARALAMDPKILFLDEPTAGLDPQGAEALDELIKNLRNSLDLTVVLVTHDLDTLWTIADKVCFLADGTAVASSSMQELVQHDDPRIQHFFSGPRGQLRQHAL